MTTAPPRHPDLRRALADQLGRLSGRAFEYLATDLLLYFGMDVAELTRYQGDGGIDVRGHLVSGKLRIPAAVQVKRQQQSIDRPAIDRFVGALLPRYATGLFLTNTRFSPGAQQKLTDRVPYIIPISGEMLLDLMEQHHLGLRPDPHDDSRPLIDVDFFTQYEERARAETQAATPTARHRVAEATQPYADGDAPGERVPPEADLISLRALSYALQVDTTTLRNWIERGTLTPDQHVTVGQQRGYFFRRDRIAALREQFGLADTPQTGDGLRQALLDFAASGRTTKAYKLVLLKVLFATVDRNGSVPMPTLAEGFRAYYLARQQAGLFTEPDGIFAGDVAMLELAEVARLIDKYPLDRFRLQRLLTYDKATDVVAFAPALWQALRYYDVLDVLTRVEEQLTRYYARVAPDDG